MAAADMDGVYICHVNPKLCVTETVDGKMYTFRFRSGILRFSDEAPQEVWEALLQSRGAKRLRSMVQRVSIAAGEEIVKQHQAQQRKGGGIAGQFTSQAGSGFLGPAAGPPPTGTPESERIAASQALADAVLNTAEGN